MSIVIPPVLNGLTTTLNTLLSSYNNQFSFVGSSANFASVVGITGAFSSLAAATGTFVNVQSTNVQASTYYNSTGTQLTLESGVFCGSLASTGAGTALLYTPIVQRGIATASSSGSYVSGLSVGPGWYRASYSVAVASIPPAAKMTAQLTFGGTALGDSICYSSNYPPTVGLGATAVVQNTHLVGFSHFAPSATGTVALSVVCSTGTCVLGGGALELYQMQ